MDVEALYVCAFMGTTAYLLKEGGKHLYTDGQKETLCEKGWEYCCFLSMGFRVQCREGESINGILEREKSCEKSRWGGDCRAKRRMWTDEHLLAGGLSREIRQ